MVLKSQGAAPALPRCMLAVLLTGGATSLPTIWGHSIVEATDGGAQERSGVRFEKSFC